MVTHDAKGGSLSVWWDPGRTALVSEPTAYPGVTVPIPKPSKIDYQVAKVYQPISLLECCGKLLERIISKRVLLDAAYFHLFPPPTVQIP